MKSGTTKQNYTECRRAIMRLSNLEEGSYNNAPEPKKMQVTVADKKANTEAWKRYQAGDSRYEFKNPTTEAEKEKAFLKSASQE